jgi:hypothetical protein
MIARAGERDVGILLQETNDLSRDDGVTGYEIFPRSGWPRDVVVCDGMPQLCVV